MTEEKIKGIVTKGRCRGFLFDPKTTSLPPLKKLFHAFIFTRFMAYTRVV